MRPTLPAAMILGLAACSRGDGGDPPGVQRIACALNGAARFTRSCTIEIVARAGRETLVVRGPDGSFRRFRRTHGLVTAAGADRPVVHPAPGGEIEVRVAADHYVLPPEFGATDAT